MRDDGIVPLICPTCQNVFAAFAQSIDPVATLHGVVFDILVGSGSGVGLAAGKRGLPSRRSRPPSPKRAPARQPSLASRAKAGGPGRTRTCNQTVMSGSADYSIVDFLQLLAAINCIRSRSDWSFLVRTGAVAPRCDLLPLALPEPHFRQRGLWYMRK